MMKLRGLISTRTALTLGPFVALLTCLLTYFLLSRVISSYTFASFLTEVDQRFQMTLVSRLAEDLKPLLAPEFQKEEVRRVLTNAERLNPRLRYYVLDRTFSVAATSLNSPNSPEGIVLNDVPIFRLLRRGQTAIPIEGDDPLQLTIKKPFAATRVPLLHGDGYLYGVIQTSEWEVGRFGARAFRSLREYSLNLLLGAMVSLAIGATLLAASLKRIKQNIITSPSAGKTPAMDEVAALAHAITSITNSLVEKASKIEDRDEQRRNFVTGITHDLRTPLSTIKLHVNSLLNAREDLEPSKREDYYKIINKNVDQVLRMMDQVFNLAKFESLEDSVKNRPFGAFECLHEVVIKFESLASEKGITLEGYFEGENIRCYGDLDLVYRALCNLVENALKYTPAGGIVKVGVERKGQRAVFFVQDTGKGIPEDELPRLFERFYRSKEAKVLKDGSAGVGLYMVKRIAEVHGGEALVQSKALEGSRFQFDIPIQS